jgi:signal transduction histidine kinase
VLLIEDVTAQHRQDRVMREFVRNAAHQLRTPLTGITTAVEVLQSGAKESPEDRDRFLAHIERDAARLTRIARGLLLLARAQSREQDIRLEFVELLPLLEELAADAQAVPGVSVEATCPPGLAALAEPSLLQEALDALLENAIAHTTDGEVRMAASASNDQVAIDVSDTGEGVPPEHRSRIFEPFYRVNEGGDGFGLGLAIAAQAARAMDGELQAADAPGGGTTFTIRLPSARVVR